MPYRTRTSVVISVAVVFIIATMLAACTTLNYYLPRPQSLDDTLLMIKADTVSDPSVDYRVLLEDGTSIRVFPKYPLTFVRGLTPGVHRAVRIESGKPGGSFRLQSVDIDVEFRIVSGKTTVFPVGFAVRKQRTQTPKGIVTITQRCSFDNLGNADLTGIRTLFERNLNSKSWEGFPLAPLAPSQVPESTFLQWQDSYIGDRPRSTCFPAGTLVVTPQGTRPIETFFAGDLVRSYDTTSGRWADKPVSSFMVHEYEGELVAITAGGGMVSATAEHPFWTLDHSDPNSGAWRVAGELEAGDILLLAGGTTAPVDTITRTSVRMTVFNLEVADFHTYAVGAGGIVVHNKGGVEAGTP